MTTELDTKDMGKVFEVGEGENSIIITNGYGTKTLSLSENTESVELILQDCTSYEIRKNPSNGDLYIDKLYSDAKGKIKKETTTIKNYLSEGYNASLSVKFNGEESFNLTNYKYITVTGNSKKASQIYGTELNDSITGGKGNDTIWAYSGENIIYSGAGNDMIYLGEGKNTVDAGIGNDTIDGTWGENTYNFTENWGSDVIISRSKDTADVINADLKYSDLFFGKSKMMITQLIWSLPQKLMQIKQSL